MNAIQCKICMDILAPLMDAGVRTCFCGNIQMRAVPIAEIGHNNLVEVKIFDGWVSFPDGTIFTKEFKQVTYEQYYSKFAQVLKIHNAYLTGEIGLREFTDDDRYWNNLFYQNKSQIVIAPLDTPGVKVINEWSNPNLETTEEYLKARNEKVKFP